jgi:cystathionine beta-lyase
LKTLKTGGDHQPMSFNTAAFDEIINRRGSGCHKWDLGRKLTGRDNLLPFWVADMDFQVAPVIREALTKRLDHSVFGYSFRPESLDEALAGWFRRRHRWNIDPSQILEVPGIVPFIHMAVREFTSPGDAVVIQEPVYHPFRRAPERNGREVLVNPLVRDSSGRWVMDLENLAELIDRRGIRFLILCSPHNPVGRVWKEEELLSLADLCRRGNVTVLSDEIHADLVLPGSRHIPWLSLPPDRLPPSIAVVSPTKSFNIPGLTTAYAIIADPELRRRTETMLASMGLGEGSSAVLSYSAAEAAWREGDEWMDGLISYLCGNDTLVRQTLEMRPSPESSGILPGSSGFRVTPLEGTYLEWVDFQGTGIGDDAMWERLLDQGIWLSRGPQFGSGGQGHFRMNIACPRAQLEEGLQMIIRAAL